jgi:hypothetical protein
MRRYHILPTTSKTRRLKTQQSEKIQSQLRDLAQREVRDAMNAAIRDAEKQLLGSLQGFGSNNSGRFFDSFNALGGTSGNASSSNSIGNFTGLLNSVVRIFSSSKRVSTSQSAATESTRSANENTFYRESRSQREAALGRLSSESTRNL